MVVELDRGTRLVGAALVMPGLTKHSEPAAAFATPLHNLAGDLVFGRNAKPSWPRSWSARKRADKKERGGHMRNIVNEDGEIIAKATKDGTLVGGHHRIIVAGSLNQKLFWQDTGEPVKLDALMHLTSHRHIA
jgi:hypothetical protein